MSAYLGILQTISVAVGFASLAGAIGSIVSANVLSRRKLREAQISSFIDALQSDDLITLGRYLDENIGAFDISEYVADDVVADRINKYLSRIQVFLGTDTEVDEEEKVESPLDSGEPSETLAPVALGFPEPFPELFEELTTGVTWNALAKLRRHLEIKLREIAESRGFKEKHLRSVGQIILNLARSKSINRVALERLRYSASVCNRAIHGRDVSDSEAMEAMWNAAIGLTDLTRSLSERPT